MKTEDIQLDIKTIFDRKKISYNPADVARMRYLCTIFIENMIELHKVCSNENQHNKKMEAWSLRGQADGTR